MHAFLEMLRYIITDSALAIIRWPIWWYTQGLAMVGKWALRSITMYAKSISLGVWIKNLFVPMFGMRDWQSRIISFFVRLFQIVVRSIGVALWIVLVILIMICYVTLPVVALASIAYHGVGGWF